MGDGEGRFAIPLETPAVKSKTENIAKRIWFWNSNYPPESFWQDMRQAFENADIVGCNPAFRVGFEYRNSVLGYIGVVNGNRFLAGARERGAETAIAANWVLGELGTAFFEKLIASQKSVGFIGPHPGLEATLHKMGADEVQSIVIPSDNIVPNANHRPHYPDVYQEVISQIDGNAQGLWLVSAGAYGKIYCNEIKEAGGVALDIGSISDQWMKLKTR
jgi:hypothetical protein